MKGTRCRGAAGWIFGHKFIKSVGGWIYRSDDCWRCGARRGGDR